MKNLAGLILCVLLAACASSPVRETPPNLLDDAAFSPPSDRIDVNDIFALNDEMQKYLDNTINHKVYLDGKISALFNELYHSNRLKFSYDATKTRNAAETFNARSGNCLSLTIMTAAFAKKMELPMQFHSVVHSEIWDRNQNIDFRIGHVNLTVGEKRSARTTPGQETARIVDFAADQDAHDEWIEDVSEETIIAMYMNNRAAEALTKNDLNNAYWWARAAMQYTPTYLTAFNTLGVIYTRHQNLPQAERIFRYVLAHEPDNLLAMSNLVPVLAAQGQVDESKALARHLAELQPYPPYFFFSRGIAAMRSGDYEEARKEFSKEVNRASYNHQFHFWLALANYYLGNVGEARKQLTIAMENSPNNAQHDLYAAKLAGITAH